MPSPASRYILSLNASSSSLKISLYPLSPNDGQTQYDNAPPGPVSLVLTSLISNISEPPAKFTLELADSVLNSLPVHPRSRPPDYNSTNANITDHASAFRQFIQTLLQLESYIGHKSIIYICHRVVYWWYMVATMRNRSS